MKLRLLITDKCNRRCAGCCNKDWDLDVLPVCTSYVGFESVMLTGGEPMLDPNLIVGTVMDIWHEHRGPIWLYTAKVDDTEAAIQVLKLVDGMCVTLHEQRDVEPWQGFHRAVRDARMDFNKSMRLNIFAGVDIGDSDTVGWEVKDNMEWVKDCPLPKDEVFMRLA